MRFRPIASNSSLLYYMKISDEEQLNYYTKMAAKGLPEIDEVFVKDARKSFMRFFKEEYGKKKETIVCFL